PSGGTGAPLVPTIFPAPWWPDVAAGGRWQAAELSSGGRCIGRLPYELSTHWGFPVSRMPHLAHLLGPAIDEGSGTANTRWLRRMDILRELMGRLPRVALFSQTCHPETTDVLGLQAL